MHINGEKQCILQTLVAAGGYFTSSITLLSKQSAQV